MKATLFLFFTTFILLIVPAYLQAQKSLYPQEKTQHSQVRSLTVENGLPQGYVNGIVQDSLGFIWLGTRDGLARYDGYQVKTFHYDALDSSTISSDVIQALYLDRDNQLWILHENRALDIFDPVTETARRIQPDGPLGWLLDEQATEPFVLRQDHRGTYWYISPGLKQIRRFTRQQPTPVEVLNPLEERIIAMEEGLDGEMYVCTAGSFFVIRDNRLHKIADLPNIRRVRTNRVSQMVQDARGNWVIMNSGYLTIFKANGEWVEFDMSGISYITDYFVCRAPGGDIYFNSRSKVFRLNQDHTLTLVWTNRNRAANIPAMMIDRSGVLWIGTNTYGARYLDLSTAGFNSHPYGHGFAYNVLAGWFHVPFDPLTHRPLADPYRFRYAYDRDGSCWVVGTPFVSPPSAGDKKRMHPHRLAKGEYLPAPIQSDSLHWIQISFDEDNKCWGIALSNNADTLLVKTYRGGGKIQFVSSWKSVFPEIGYLTAYHGKLCIVYPEGIELFDPATGKSVVYRSKDLFGDAKLLMAVPDPELPGVLWIASLGYGLIKFNTVSRRVEAFTVKDGIPSNSVYAAVLDRHGNLWCSSNKGIFRFAPNSHKVLSFVAGDGLQGNEFNRYHFLKSPGGHIFFGGTHGWTVFHPDSIHIDTYQPATVITRILVNNIPITKLREWKDSAVTAINGLSLNYSQNFITFNFAGMQFSNTGKLNYRYRLQGFDEDWIEVGNQHTANYTNLPPGDYVFEANSSNTAGIWSSHIKTLAVFIYPPWWKTWLAYAVYALLGIAAGYAFYRYRLNRLRTRQQLIRQEEEARQLRAIDEMKTRFFSNITHEFRTPLSLILAPLEQINQDTKVPLSLRRKTARIQGSAEQLLGLINQLLDMSKMEAGNMAVSLSRGDLGLFIADHIKGFETQLSTKGIRFHFDNNLQGVYQFDADKWQKILFNLLSNAIKFTPGGRRINVSLNACDRNGTDAVELRVKDTGIGIPADKLPFIFDRFYQADDSATRSHGGTGIGLALVKELTELMDGTIAAESEQGKGTLFRVLIPVESALDPGLMSESSAGLASGTGVASESSAGLAAPGLTSGTGMASDGGAGRKAPMILLVEDNKDLNEFVAETLGKMYRVIRAYNGREGLQKAKESLPDLVISDIMMPELDGYTLCKELKGTLATDHIAFILLSAKASHDSIITGLENHADDYITKPFHIDELQLRVHNLVQRQKKLRRYHNRQLTAPDEQLDAHNISDRFLKQLYAVIEECLDDTQFDVGLLAEKMAVSRRTLNRKLAVLVNLSAVEVIRQYRLKRAAALLQSGLNVSETAYRVGFTSISYFSNSFKKFYGVVPSAAITLQHSSHGH